MNDPFKNFKPLNQTRSGQRKNSQSPKGDSFIEQIKSIGSSTVSSLKTDVVKGTAQSIFNQLLGGVQSGETPSTNQPNQSEFTKWLENRDAQTSKEAKSEERTLQQHKHQQEKVLFSFTDEKLKQEIGEVRQEITMLVKTMGKLESQIEQTIMQEIIDPGIYHLNFFRKLVSWLHIIRKNLEDASLWMELSAGRGKRSHYWNQVNKSGTKYSMSSERTLATSIG